MGLDEDEERMEGEAIVKEGEWEGEKLKVGVRHVEGAHRF